MAVHSKQLLQLLLVAILIAATKTQPMSKTNCRDKCGSVNIPFPFGMTKECSLNPSFLIICNQTSFTHTHIPFLYNNNTNNSVPLLSISLLDGELRISLPVVKDCYNYSSYEDLTDIGWRFYFNLTPFQLSPNRNKLTVVGVDTAGFVVPYTNTENKYTAPMCLSLYTKDLLVNGSCSGIGCCQTPIQQGISSFSYYTAMNVINDSSFAQEFSTKPIACGSAFLVENGSYNFLEKDLLKLDKEEFPVVVDWAVGNQTCKDSMNLSSYACKADNSRCDNATDGNGYLCRCRPGFQGNPYLPHGCLDVDECKGSNDCIHREKCKNYPGSYNCSCRKGFVGDGKVNGSGCKKDTNSRDIILVTTLSVSIGIIALLGGSFYVYWAFKKRKLMKLKEHFFEQNGGLLLQQRVARHRGSEMTKVFTVEELKRATNNFNPDRILGQGGQGTVYKGVLLDNRTVAIKKSKISDPNQIEQFINEVMLLSEINHRNVVKLLGCCLETEVPMLVYEFISNGTVYEHLHGQSQSLKLTWKTRLRIATETAEALAYLHSATSEPIIHRDVKTTNILLDHNLTAKVSDFGASRIVPLDQTQLTTLVQGTLGYLDPEYLHTSHLTEKSDVYSFGVVLAELLTGKKALAFHKQECVTNLALFFVSSMKEDRLLDTVDPHIIDEATANVDQLMEFAKIAKQCLKVKREERPTMKEVAMELAGLRFAEMHQRESANMCSEDTEISLQSEAYVLSVENDAGGSSGISSGVDSLNQISTTFPSGR
ncbi:wall-associated receptor kinase 1-like [Abrus precatorius]|uniref:Wall-associated receptor kinase 1-like n=1 Tax=Abrus precatorius TaxID=3816 RepID=A0A8B8K2K6_ABRPR|nr:wall-associated receptor kinase 1-like [Abrus precatorius]